MKVWQAYVIFFLIAICWGLGFPLTKEGLIHLGPVSFMFARFVVAVVLILMIRPKACFVMTRKEALVGAVLGVCLGLGFIVQTIGLETTSSGKTGFITSLNILVVPLLSSFLFGLHILMKDRFAILLAILGFGLLSFNSFGEGISSGDLWVLACAFFFAFQIVGIDRFTRGLNAYRVNLAQLISALVLCGAVAALREQASLSHYVNAAGPIVITAVLSIAFPLVAQMYAQRAISSTSAALIMSLEAVFAVLFGWWIHQEVLLVREYLGCLVIMLATFMILAPKSWLIRLWQGKASLPLSRDDKFP